MNNFNLHKKIMKLINFVNIKVFSIIALNVLLFLLLNILPTDTLKASSTILMPPGYQHLSQALLEETTSPQKSQEPTNSSCPSSIKTNKQNNIERDLFFANAFAQNQLHFVPNRGKTIYFSLKELIDLNDEITLNSNTSDPSRNNREISFIIKSHLFLKDPLLSPIYKNAITFLEKTGYLDKIIVSILDKNVEIIANYATQISASRLLVNNNTTNYVTMPIWLAPSTPKPNIPIINEDFPNLPMQILVQPDVLNSFDHIEKYFSFFNKILKLADYLRIYEYHQKNQDIPDFLTTSDNPLNPTLIISQEDMRDLSFARDLTAQVESLEAMKTTREQYFGDRLDNLIQNTAHQLRAVYHLQTEHIPIEIGGALERWSIFEFNNLDVVKALEFSRSVDSLFINSLE